MTHTHIIQEYPTTNVEKLYRSADGMQLGGRQEATVLYGEDINRAVSRVFLTNGDASKFLREVVTKEDLKGQEISVSLDVRNAESLISQPGQVMVMPGSGSIRKLN